MTDPIGLIHDPTAIAPKLPGHSVAPGKGVPGGFQQELLDQLKTQITQVNQLQQDADKATEDLAAGRRDDLEGVMIATEKADTAFKLLLSLRNKMMDDYDEVKQIRV